MHDTRLSKVFGAEQRRQNKKSRPSRKQCVNSSLMQHTTRARCNTTAATNVKQLSQMQQHKAQQLGRLHAQHPQSARQQPCAPTKQHKLPNPHCLSRQSAASAGKKACICSTRTCTTMHAKQCSTPSQPQHTKHGTINTVHQTNQPNK